MSEHIPVIDVAQFRAGVAGATAKLGSSIQDALERIGFMVLTGHGVPAHIIDGAFDQARRFHAQPLSSKMTLAMNEHNNGYMAKGLYAVWTSEVNANDRPDLNESIFFKRERSPDDPQVRPGRRFVGPNQWPLGLPGFKRHVLAYADSMDAFAMHLLPALEHALGLEPDYLGSRCRPSQFSLRLSHYPPEQALPNQFGIAPHTDSNLLTFLPLSDVPGLQVQMPDGRWLDVPHMPGALAVNCGDTLHRWSNSRFKSTPHRALPPVARHRYAIPFFFGPNIDTLVECLPSCCGPKNPPRWPPISYEDWLLYWYDANYDYRQQGLLAAKLHGQPSELPGVSDP